MPQLPPLCTAKARAMLGTTCYVVLALAPATAELPPPRPPAAPFPAEPAPVAKTVRRLHEIVPQQDEDKQMSEEEMAASFQRFLDARGGRIEPLWANHSHAERTANLQLHHASRQSERRRMQMGAIMGSL